ncbi:hypothetical protein HanPI659440_Chr13g0510671 [Helianthus annuus]|nr:hypothetical protein HanPI659440_Chr13g0510671 [Helianthus annuus]
MSVYMIVSSLFGYTGWCNVCMFFLLWVELVVSVGMTHIVNVCRLFNWFNSFSQGRPEGCAGWVTAQGPNPLGDHFFLFLY